MRFNNAFVSSVSPVLKVGHFGKCGGSLDARLAKGIGSNDGHILCCPARCNVHST